ncbi:MAG: radical SAM protein [Bacteroidetes bacterium]|nr:radical SAM protein [Bacteroidota bacterium]
MLKPESIILHLNRFKSLKFRFQEADFSHFSNNPGVSVHIPFCNRNCPFCPVYKVEPNETLIERFIARLLDEILKSPVSGPADWVHFSGGCPSLLKFEQLSTISNALRKKFSFSTMGIDLLPEKIDPTYFSELKNLGFTHINAGIQSFSSQSRSLSAIHDSNQFPLLDFIRSAKSAGLFINAELLTGIPGTSADSLQFDLFQLLSVLPDQVTVRPFIVLPPVTLKPVLEDREQFALIEWSAGLLTGHGYYRTGLWTFSKTGETYNIPLKQLSSDFVGFGSFAFSVSEKAYSVNPVLPVYLNPSEKRVLVAERSTHDEDWGKFVKSIFEMKLTGQTYSDPVLQLFIVWLKSSGHVKAKSLTPKGIKFAHKLIKSVFESFSLPFENPELILNSEDYMTAVLNSQPLELTEENLLSSQLNMNRKTL